MDAEILLSKLLLKLLVGGRTTQQRAGLYVTYPLGHLVLSTWHTEGMPTVAFQAIASLSLLGTETGVRVCVHTCILEMNYVHVFIYEFCFRTCMHA